MDAVIRKILAFAIVFPSCFCLSDELDIASAALRDRLYPIARTHAQKVMDESSGDLNKALLILLEALCEEQRAQDALDLLERHQTVVRQAPEPALFVYWRAVALLKTGQAAEAARVASSVKEGMSAELADALLRVAARAHQASGDRSGALALFAEVDHRSTNIVTRAANALERAIALEAAAQPDEAIEVLKEQSALGVRSAEVDEGALLWSRLLLRQAKVPEANLILQRLAKDAQVSERVRIQALTEMGVSALTLGKTNEAVTLARSAYQLATQPELRRLSGFRLGDLLCGNAKTIDEGERLIKALVREYPEDAVSIRTYLKLADALLQLNEPERAANEYRIFLETYPASSLDEQVLQGRAWALLQLGHAAEAATLFQRVAEMTTHAGVRAECLFKQADALMADQRYAEASRIYLRVSEERPDDPLAVRAMYQSAECLERAGQTVEAGDQYRRVAALYPASDQAPKALLRLATLQANAHAFDAAIRTYVTICETYPTASVRSEALIGKGKIAYRIYRFDEAMQSFSTVAETDVKRRDEARFLIILCLYGLGRDKEARTSATSFILDFPESPWLREVMLWLGKLDYNRGKFADARKSFTEYVSRWASANWADAALLWAARAASAEGDFTGAVELITRLVREYPKSLLRVEALLVQADALMELARFAEAALLLDQIMAETPANEQMTQVKIRKGDCLFALGADHADRYLKALAVYRDVLQQQPISPSLLLQMHYKVGRTLEKLNRIDEAVEVYYSEVVIRYLDDRVRGIWFDASDTGLFMRAAFNIADLYEQKGRPDLAVHVLNRVLQADVPGKEETQARVERLRKKR